jgi:hypothetical protein
MTTWYVRPDTSHSATRNGTSYATAWGGWSSIVWGGAGVIAGDTLYVCGVHTSASQLAVGAHGALVGSRVVIRGDYDQGPGSMVFSGSSWLLNNQNYTTIKNLPITAGSSYCVYLSGAPNTGTTIQGCTLTSAATVQIINLHGAESQAYVDLTIDGNTFIGGTGTNIGAAIHWLGNAALLTARYLTRVTIINNSFTGCSSNRAVIDLRVEDDALDTCKITDLIVTGNTFRDCYGVALEAYANVYGRNTGIRVTDNLIYNLANKPAGMGGAFSIGGFGLSASDTFGTNIIARNKAYRIAGPSGFVNPFFGSYTIYDNYAEDISTDTIDGCGILFDHGTDGCVAYGNHFKRITGTGADGYYSGGFGILVLDGINLTAYGNIFDGCVNGVAFGNKNAAQSSNIFNNTFCNCSQSGAFMGAGASTTTNLVRNNIFTAARSIPSVKNNAATWTGESSNCFYAFGATSGHTLHASTVTVNPELGADYRPGNTTLKRAGTYLGGKDFSSKNFYNPPNFGAVDELTATPRYTLRKY